jgi:hypothetical protein
MWPCRRRNRQRHIAHRCGAKATPDRSGSKCLSEYQQRQAILHVRSSEMKYIPLDCAHAIVPEQRQISSCEAVAERLDPCRSEGKKDRRRYPQDRLRDRGDEKLLYSTQHSSLRMGSRGPSRWAIRTTALGEQICKGAFGQFVEVGLVDYACGKQRIALRGTESCPMNRLPRHRRATRSADFIFFTMR